MNELLIFLADIVFALGLLAIFSAVGLYIFGGEPWILSLLP